MNKQEFLATQLPYGLKCHCMGLHFDDYAEPVIPIDVEIVGLNTHHVEIQEIGRAVTKQYVYSDIFPIIRPLDSLVKECIQADYNNGEPFIPIVELAKIFSPHYDWHLHGKGLYATAGNKLYGSIDFEYDDAYGIFLRDSTADGINQLQLFQQLLKWHFWPNMPENEEVIYVTEEFNPYKCYEL